MRGVAGSAELSPELALRLGHAAAALAAARSGRRPRALVGRDPRRSGPMLEAALTAGICAAGGDVVHLGVVTTPAVALLTKLSGADLGVMISASHNPAEYNGIKFFSGDGCKLPDAEEDRLADLALAPADLDARPTADGVGVDAQAPELVERYVEHLVGTGASLAGLRVVVDCGHGAAYRVSPEVLRRLGAEVIALNVVPDGLNINDHCGSTHPEVLQAAVRAHGAHAGIAHDGDADRCIAVDERGEVVDGDQIMAICALDRYARGALRQDTLVVTVMSNLGLTLAMRQAGIRLATTKVGDRYVLEAMLKEGYNLGGEQSGHVIFLDHNTTGDGILTAVQLLSVAARSGKPLSELAACMRRLPQVLENVKVRDKNGWEQNLRIASAVSAAEAALGGLGRVLGRASGTEPLIRVMLEGPDEAELHRLAGGIRDVVIAELSG